MSSNSCRVYLQHEYAHNFFYSALHPNVDELRRRDAFFAELENTFRYWSDGSDLVAEIPDIDVASLACADEGYLGFRPPAFSTQPMVIIEGMCYRSELMLNVAA